MQQLTQITDTLFGMAIPVHSKGFAITNNVKGDHFLRYIDDVINLVDIEGEHKVIGTVSTTQIDFDCELYVEKMDEIDRGAFIEKIYKDYVGDMVYYYSKNKSFRSLLSSKGITPTNETKVLILEKV